MLTYLCKQYHRICSDLFANIKVDESTSILDLCVDLIIGKNCLRISNFFN
jgi:hypothetical protein